MIRDGANEQVGLPSIAKRFRGKPLLVYGKESSVVRGPGFAELDLNAHAFSYVGRKVTFGGLFLSVMIRLILLYTGVLVLPRFTLIDLITRPQDDVWRAVFVSRDAPDTSVYRCAYTATVHLIFPRSFSRR